MGQQYQDKDWNGEDSDEDDNSNDDLDVSDEDDAYYMKKPKGRLRGNSGRGLKPTKEHKSFPAPGRRKRGSTSLEDEDSYEKDSENDSDEDFKSMTRRGAHLRKSKGGQSSTTANIIGRNSELRTSSRSVRKVSYVESEESEEIDEGKKKKSQKVHSAYLLHYSNVLIIFPF